MMLRILQTWKPGQQIQVGPGTRFLKVFYLAIIASHFLANNTVCGYCVVRGVGKELEILNMVISLEHQGRGLGGYFLEHILGLEEFSGITDYWLEVRFGNLAARGLYKKIGFCVAGKRRGYYSRSGKSEDALIMQRSVTPPDSSGPG